MTVAEIMEAVKELKVMYYHLQMGQIIVNYQ